MRLAPLFCRFAGLMFVFAVMLAPLQAIGQGAPTRILFVGKAADAGLEASPLPSDALIVLDRLPAKGGVEAALFGARLKANPVSSLPDSRPVPSRSVDELFLVLRAGLSIAADGPQLSLGGEGVAVPGFGARLVETVQAFDARFRRVAFLEIIDPDDAFPDTLPALRTMMEPLGFDMLVVMIARSEAQACAGLEPLHFSIAGGLADRAPFGDGNGATTMAEAETYLANALRRAVKRGCEPAYSLILKPVDDAGRVDDAGPVVVAHPLAPMREVEDRLAREAFEAMFLAGSDNLEALSDYLGSCSYCPQEAALSARMQAKAARARIAALEEQMWQEIRDDRRRDRLATYVDHCRLCVHSDEALTRIERLDAEAAAVERERTEFLAAQGARDLAGLRAYAETCLACVHGDEARALIAELEADSAYLAERALLAEALERQNPAQLEAYLGQCRVCDGIDEVETALDRLAALDALRRPCLDAAGLPQSGGPRRLEDIDQEAALAACGAAAKAFPDDGPVRVMLGRIAQAKGDFAAAGAAYAFGMERGVPAAFGLAAFAEYAPPDGGPIDPIRVEALGLQGAAQGDWLSQEVLTVLYSKDLVPGKSGREAFDTAMKIALEGDPVAQYLVGQYYLSGIGGERSEDKAAQWLQKAVDAGFLQANAFLAKLYEQGQGAPARPGLAAELYWTALGQGDATATDQLTTELASRSAEVVRIIQGKLREQGLYQGVVDGVPGPGTAAAIRAYADSLSGQG